MCQKQLSTKQISVHNIILILGIIFIAFNLRPAITSVGPLISMIRVELGISNTLAGSLTTLPLLAFGVFSLVAPKMGRKFGNERTIFFAFLTIFTGILLRSTGLITALFIGTAILGLGIAICNVIISGIIKDKFPEKLGMMTGIYITSMSIMAALASGLAVPLAENYSLGWEKSLGVWALLPLIGILIWLPQLKNKHTKIKSSVSVKSSIWRSSLAWQVTLFMGFQSCIFYCLISWLPEILYSRGIDIATGGWLLTVMQFAGLPATLLIPVLASRISNQRPIVASIAILYLVGFTGIFLSGNMILVVAFIIALGVAQGAGISLALTLFALRAENAEGAANLSGMAQSGGYSLAAIGPFFMGYLFDSFQTWTPAFVMFGILCIGLLIAGLGAGRDLYILQSEQKQAKMKA
ncbi:MFS transporter [Salipaludibacillus neizhouensis]|uniref:MFS transporter n=1 Tax=Salipaludibacillus neizhouensis TaxID=885475 RepID=A0A3A9K1W7_9BACI|nr:MFS transporter [Salipaludibacillus neizhouensis]RKL67114.1 MFS transporter [Salipaludibacillus neizhouensis]